MEISLPEGKRTEKEATCLTDVSQQEKKTDTAMLEQIDGKLDLLLQASGTGTEG